MINMEEIWKDINGYEGEYRISNYGRVFSLKKNLFLSQCKRTSKNHKGETRENYYWGVVFTDRSKIPNQKGYFVHRLVGIAFIPNPENKPTINHINGDTLDNHISNLEWATSSENNQHAHDTGLSVCTTEKPIDCFDYKTGNYVQTFKSTREAGRVLNIASGGISNNLRGYSTRNGIKRKSNYCKGYYFKYSDKGR
jgi:hypothetical protein